MRSKIIKFLLCFALIFSAGINLLGALSPEVGFDALWYHLTLPKLYLEAGRIYYVSGGLLYYSEMPRLAEFLYIPLIKLAGDTGPHILSWLSGIGIAVIIYKISRKYLDPTTSLLSTCLFYTTPLVGWQSGSAYVDLIRTFFEVLAFYLVIDRRFIWAAVVMGFAASTKTLALGSIPILAIISFLHSKRIITPFIIIIIPLLIAFPWFLSAYNNTGFPFYPIGAGVLDNTHSPNLDFWNLPKLFHDYVGLFLFPTDLISPIYLFFIPFLFFLSGSRPKKTFNLFITYFVLAFLLWYFIPHTGGGRFILPYLPVVSVLIGLTVFWQKYRLLKIFLTSLILASILVNVFYRTAAISRNLPYLLGRETKEEFLCKRLDFKTSVFVDCDGFFKKTIKPTDLVLVKNLHNLYYINFPFVHETWFNGEKYNYVLSGKPLANLKLIYENPTTSLYLYKP